MSRGNTANVECLLGVSQWRIWIACPLPMKEYLPVPNSEPGTTVWSHAGLKWEFGNFRTRSLCFRVIVPMWVAVKLLPWDALMGTGWLSLERPLKMCFEPEIMVLQPVSKIALRV